MSDIDEHRKEIRLCNHRMGVALFFNYNFCDFHTHMIEECRFELCTWTGSLCCTSFDSLLSNALLDGILINITNSFDSWEDFRM